jgi:hypothetical protein
MPLTTPDCVLLRIKVVVSAVTFHPLNGFKIRITDTWTAIVQDTRTSDCTPYLRTEKAVKNGLFQLREGRRS